MEEEGRTLLARESTFMKALENWREKRKRLTFQVLNNDEAIVHEDVVYWETGGDKNIAKMVKEKLGGSRAEHNEQ